MSDAMAMTAGQRDGAEGGAAVSFGERLVRSEAFKALFREGMDLVEATAAYLDGEGREASRALGRAAALAYATESMRLTTRLMQATSWLLLQRAVNEGELTREEAETEHRRVRLVPEETAASPEAVEQVPIKLAGLIEASMRLQERILRLDGLLKGRAAPQANPVARQMVELEQRLGAMRPIPRPVGAPRA